MNTQNLSRIQRKILSIFSDRLSAIHKSEKVVGKCWTNKKPAYIMTSQSMKRQEVIQIGPAAMSRVDGCIGSGIDGFKNRRNSKWLDRDPVACWLSDQRYGSWNEGILSFLIGTVLPILLLFWLFHFRMFGAGDIKLFQRLEAFSARRQF